MSELEQIVRPAQDGSIRPVYLPQLLAAPKVSNPNAVTWGSASASIFQASASISQSVPPAKWPKSDEIKRTYDIVKVMNPDDHSQYVHVEAMTEYQARNAIDKSRVTLKYASQGASEHVEIVSTGNVRTSGEQ
jgi:hypothetical protein